jgi:hypothetical protein
MYKTEEQKQAEFKAAVVEKAREIIARHKEVGQPTAQAARQVWAALRDAKTWSIVEGPKPNDGEYPRDPNWQEPEEVWQMVPEIVKKADGDRAD